MRLARYAEKADAFLISLSKRAFAAACVLLAATFSLKSLIHGNLFDPDDYVYLVQSMDWFKGQGWFDLIQHRINPPEGTYVHYSHILTGLYGSLIYIVHFFLKDVVVTAIVVSAIVPIIYLLLYLAVAHWVGKSLFGEKRIELVDYVILFSPSLLFQFSAGHIDHHGLEILIALTVFGCLMSMVLQPKKIHWPIIGGITLAFGLVVGLEFLAVFIVFTGWVGLRAIFEGKDAARNGMIFGATAFVASVAFLAVTRAPHAFFNIDMQAYSIVYVVFTASIALCLAGIALADHTGKRSVRIGAGLGLAALTGGLFLYAFPELKGGPYGATDPIIRKLIIESGSESIPLIHSEELGMGAAIWPLMAFVISGFYLMREKKAQQRWIWGLFFLILGFCIPLSLFYQCRFQTYVETFSVIPIACAIQRNWEALKGFRTTTDKMRMATLIILMMAGPLALHLFIARTAEANGTEKGGLSAPTSGTWGCDIHNLTSVLNDPQQYGDRPRLIMNSMEQGPELLFLTQHKVIAAPLHLDVSGNLDALQFFTTRNAVEAQSITTEHGAELVILCNIPAQLVAYLPAKKDDGEPNFTQQLISGDVPSWLKRIQSPSFGNLMVFEVRK